MAEIKAPVNPNVLIARMRRIVWSIVAGIASVALIWITVYLFEGKNFSLLESFISAILVVGVLGGLLALAIEIAIFACEMEIVGRYGIAWDEHIRKLESEKLEKENTERQIQEAEENQLRQAICETIMGAGISISKIATREITSF